MFTLDVTDSWNAAVKSDRVVRTYSPRLSSPCPSSRSTWTVIHQLLTGLHAFVLSTPIPHSEWKQAEEKKNTQACPKNCMPVFKSCAHKAAVEFLKGIALFILKGSWCNYFHVFFSSKIVRCTINYLPVHISKLHVIYSNKNKNRPGLIGIIMYSVVNYVVNYVMFQLYTLSDSPIIHLLKYVLFTQICLICNMFF